MYKNVAGQKIVVYAHDTAADGPKTGDSANITIHLCKDGGTSASLGSPSELDSTNQKGKYILTLTQAQSNADLLSFSAYSTTSNIVLEGVEIYTVVELATDITTLVNSNLALSSARGSLVANGGEQVIYENAAPSADWIADTVA
ncbi:MAG: hypothetical protein KAI14_05930, partial [Dehalococcoidales bacterium]|nr:hypothetical protein [Dehalococcoidales bacterium]